MGFDRKTDFGYSASGTGDTEFSWGAGPVPPGKEFASPENGGQYVGRSPDMVDPPKGRYRHGGAPHGYAGERIG